LAILGALPGKIQHHLFSALIFLIFAKHPFFRREIWRPVGANSALMMPNAANLSDDEIANLAAYISENFQ